MGIFPNDAAALRLITALVVETHGERAVAERRYLSEESMAKLHPPDTEPSDEARHSPSRLIQPTSDNEQVELTTELYHPAGLQRGRFQLSGLGDTETGESHHYSESIQFSANMPFPTATLLALESWPGSSAFARAI